MFIWTVVLISLGLTAITLIAGIAMGDIDMVIVFGVLHCIALSLILVGILEKFIPHKSFYLIMGIIMTTFGILLEIDSKYVSLQNGNVFLVILETIIGLCATGSDHFPILLNGGQVFIGVFLGKQLYSSRKSLFKNAKYKNNIVLIDDHREVCVHILV